MDGITVLIMLSIAILVLLIFIILKSSKVEQTKNTDESLTLLDRSFERQETKLNDLADQLIEFNKPLDKLNRYLSGGTQAGKFGEWSLESIISDILPINQYEKNAETISGSGKRVEFAIKLPEGLLMPIDAKFPSGLYDGYLEATRSGDDRIVKNSLNEIRRKVLSDAEDINTKYIQSGITTDMGVMFIPSEALLQLIDTIGNIREQIFRDHRILVMGPNSLAAYLISINVGFKTISLNERASEIMIEFGKLKKEFENFSSSTEELDKKVNALQKTINEHLTRERQMAKALKSMDELDK